MIFDELIKRAKKEKWDVCIYGLGYLGVKLNKEIPEMLGLNVDYYCDSSRQRVDDIQLTGVSGIYKSDLLKWEKPMLVLIMVDNPYDKEIKEELSRNNNLHLFTIRELAGTANVIRKFYGEDVYRKVVNLPNYRSGKTI